MSKLSPAVQTEQTVDNEIKCVKDLIRHLNVSASKWHILAATDGSGSEVTKPIGYASYIIHKAPYKVKHLVGYSSFGGVQEAEIRAVFDVVSYAMRVRPAAFEQGYYVHILTDSSYVHRQLSEMDPVKLFKVKSHSHLWTGIHQARRRGIIIVPHLFPRNTYMPMIAADAMSKQVRKHGVNLDTHQSFVDLLAGVERKFPLDRSV